VFRKVILAAEMAFHFQGSAVAAYDAPPSPAAGGEGPISKNSSPPRPFGP